MCTRALSTKTPNFSTGIKICYNNFCRFIQTIKQLLVELFILIIYLASVIFTVASIWKVFTKAGKPGWACIVPIYNYIVMLEIAKKPMWWLVIILLVPIVNIVLLIMLINAIAISFGKRSGFTVGLIFLPFIFWPILGFGDAQYIQKDVNMDSDLLDN